MNAIEVVVFDEISIDAVAIHLPNKVKRATMNILISIHSPIISQVMQR